MISWFEIPVADLDRARKFYEAIFGSTLHERNLANQLRMAVFPVESGAVGGALCQHPGFYRPSHDGTLVYLNGDPDLQLVLSRVAPAGGKVIVPKTQISPEHGYMAVFEDSEGNRIALHSRR
jgi:hypothetical protein